MNKQKITIEVTEDELQLLLVGLTCRTVTMEHMLHKYPRDTENTNYWVEQKKLADNLYWDLMPILNFIILNKGENK